MNYMLILAINRAIQHNNKTLQFDGKEIICVALDQTCTFRDGSEISLSDEQLIEVFHQSVD